MPNSKDFVTLDFDEALAAVRGVPRAASFNTGPTPDEIHAVYSRGFQGVRPDRQTPEQRVKFSAMIEAMPRLYEVFPWAKGIGKGKVNCPYAAVAHFDKEWGGRDAQERGDCCSHGARNSCAIDYGVDCLFGETKWMGQLCTENIYRSRGYNGDGWDCETPCVYVGPEGKGGLLYRKNWTNGAETADLSEYNSSWAGNGRAGNPAWLEEESRKNKVKWIIPISEAEEYRDCIAMGFGINVCSGQGFASSTDENGVAAARGSWSHSMGHVAVIDTDWARSKYSDMIGGIQQSWGNWNTINGKPEGSPNMPTGMFYSRMKTVLSMISGRDSYACCGVFGWERTNWEAFVALEFKPRAYGEKLKEFLQSSTAQDYYKQRQEKLEEYTKKVAEGTLFQAI